MLNLICWICEGGRASKEYEGTELLSDIGEKPCLECILEEIQESQELEEIQKELES